MSVHPPAALAAGAGPPQKRPLRCYTDSVSRLIVYVDGFNFYYGAVKQTPYKWLNFNKLFKILFPKDDLVLVRYFTARVKNNPLNPGQRGRQGAYLRALRTLPDFEIHEGFFLSHPVNMPVAPPGTGFARVLKFEEKGSDVNLATYLMLDAIEDRFDVAAVVSHDSDLALPIQIVNERLGKPVGVVGYDPRFQRKYGKRPRTSERLRQVAAFYKTLRESAFRRAQFPDVVQSQDGPIHKPSGW